MTKRSTLLRAVTVMDSLCFAVGVRLPKIPPLSIRASMVRDFETTLTLNETIKCVQESWTSYDSSFDYA